MRPDRGETTNEDLLDRVEKTLVELRRREEQLEKALEEYDGFAGREQFIADFTSENAADRNRAEVLHSAFERHHQLVRDLANNSGKLGARSGEIAKRASGANWHEHLAGEGVLSSNDAKLIDEQTDVRDESQHAYIEANPGEIYDAAMRQLNNGRKVVGKLAKWIDGLRGKV